MAGQESEYPKNLGNYTEEDIHGVGVSVTSLAEEWEQQGLRWATQPPVATEFYTTEQLAGWGLVSVVLLGKDSDENPKPQATE